MSFWYLALLTAGLIMSILFLLVAFGTIGPYNSKKRDETNRVIDEQKKTMNSIQEALDNASSAINLKALVRDMEVGNLSPMVASRMGGHVVFGTNVENHGEGYILSRKPDGQLTMIDTVLPDAGYQFAENRSAVSPTGRFVATTTEPTFQEDTVSLEEGYVEIWPSRVVIGRENACAYRAAFDDEDDSSLYVTFFTRLHVGVVVHYERSILLNGDETWEPTQEITVSDAAPFEFFGSSVYTRNNVMVVSSRVAARVYLRANRKSPWEFSQRLMVQVGAGLSVASNDNASVLFVSAPYETVDGEEGAGTVTTFGLQNGDASLASRYYEKMSQIVSPNGATSDAAFGIKIACENNHLMILESDPDGNDPQVLYHYNWSKGALLQSIPAENITTQYNTGLTAWSNEKGEAGMLLSEQDPDTLATYVSIYE